MTAAEGSIEIGRLRFDLGPRPVRCGIHGDEIADGRCPTCDEEASFPSPRQQVEAEFPWVRRLARWRNRP